MVKRRNNIKRCDADPCKKFGPLSYGLDSEEDVDFSDTSQFEVPKYLWRILLMDAVIIYYFHFHLRKVGSCLLLLIFVIVISGVIVWPCKLHSFPQVEVQSGGKTQQFKSESTANTEENRISTKLFDEEGSPEKTKIKEVHLKVLDLCKEGDESNILTSELTMLNTIKYKRKCNKDSVMKDDGASESRIEAQQDFCVSNDLDSYPCGNYFHKISNLEERIQELTSLMLDSKFKEQVQCKISPEEHEIREIVRDEIMKRENEILDHEIREIVRDEIIKRENEMLGLADFALENSGGSIISTPKTITYSTKSVILLFGFPLWFVGSSPRNIIQASVNPGDCWAFHGSFGNIRIRLAEPVIITSFSLYHIPKQLSPTGKINSAPRNFSVVGIEDDLQAEIVLGNFQYSDRGPPLQSFTTQIVLLQPLSTVELRIRSNYGNTDFTCIYRFQVHGRLTNHQ